MSYILDALKKSERERSLGNVPTLNTVHSYPKSSASWRWLWLALVLLIMLMLIGVTVYGVMFWSQDDVVQSASEKSHTASTSARRAVAAKKPASAAVTKPALTNADPPQTEAKLPAPVKPPTSRSATTTPTLRSYPTIDDMDDGMRQRLSDVVVNVVSYSEQPSRRFVMINQKIYRQGQRVTGQLAVVEIKPEGAILRFQGREFLVAP
jgi:general secretion pathway protein B